MITVDRNGQTDKPVNIATPHPRHRTLATGACAPADVEKVMGAEGILHGHRGEMFLLSGILNIQCPTINPLDLDLMSKFQVRHKIKGRWQKWLILRAIS